jgi:hypothetical protein
MAVGELGSCQRSLTRTAQQTTLENGGRFGPPGLSGRPGELTSNALVDYLTASWLSTLFTPSTAFATSVAALRDAALSTKPPSSTTLLRVCTSI